MATSGAGVARKLPAAIRHLCNHGVEALKPQLILNSKTRNATHWNPPRVNSRRSNQIRRRAIQEGTYGSFDSKTGIGWDPAWDIELTIFKNRNTPNEATTSGGRYRIRPKKKTSRERTREERAQKIEKNLETMDEEIAKYYIEKSKDKPVKDWEYYYKKHGKRR